MVFERHIVYPSGHREIEGKTPKQLPAPSSHDLPDPASDASHALPSDEPATQHARDIAWAIGAACEVT
jgi:hypothetical protein